MTATHEFEKLGQFYLGRTCNLQQKQPAGDLLLYDSRDLVTHAVCVGMTGSSKTGLCVALIEEAAIDGVPALVIDPKGDLANLPEPGSRGFRAHSRRSPASRRRRTSPCVSSRSFGRLMPSTAIEQPAPAW